MDFVVGIPWSRPRRHAIRWITAASGAERSLPSYTGIPGEGIEPDARLQTVRAALKLQVVVPLDHRLEIFLPEEVPAGPAEVILLTDERRPERQRKMGMDAGHGWVADDFDAPLPDDLERLFTGLS